MKLQVRLFAAARQLAGAEMLEIELPDGATVGQLRRHIAAECPPLAAMVPQMMIAVANDYVSDGEVLDGKTDVACIPPVSGG